MKDIALITGTGRGIGKALAKLLLINNYNVYGYSRSNSIQHKNFKFIKTDLSNLDSIKKIQLPKVEFSSKILMVNNAATIGEILPINIKSEQHIISEYNLNIICPTILIKKFINSYSNNKLLINISSGAANKAIPAWSTYCTTKSGLDMLTKVITEEKHNNLKAFSIYPGVVDTDMQKNIRTSEKKYFPLQQKFIDYYKNNELLTTNNVAHKLLQIIKKSDDYSENIINLSEL